MTPPPSTASLTRQQIADLYFMEHRAKVLDLAAFLDRLDRARPGEGAAPDPRISVLDRALGVLIDHKPERARRILELMSDPTIEPIAKAGTKGAVGVWPGAGDERGGRA